MIKITVISVFVLCLLSCEKVNDFEDHFRDLENKVHTGLPIVSVNTPNGEPILSKDEYVKNATFTSFLGGGYLLVILMGVLV